MCHECKNFTGEMKIQSKLCGNEINCERNIINTWVDEKQYDVLDQSINSKRTRNKTDINQWINEGKQQRTDINAWVNESKQ